MTDIAVLALDNAVPFERRAALAWDALGDPHAFRAGGVAVTLGFAGGGPCVHDVFTAFLARKKSGL